MDNSPNFQRVLKTALVFNTNITEASRTKQIPLITGTKIFPSISRYAEDILKNNIRNILVSKPYILT